MDAVGVSTMHSFPGAILFTRRGLPLLHLLVGSQILAGNFDRNSNGER
jgi:hypothetical protein